uniref:TPR_REGION domain-containing protein n=1 Tax=Steinernema glaseri TaxID=37863 RepID=A0A1I8AIJ3_9BILA
MGEYRDSWSEFRSILDATKKKLLKRPRYDDMKAVAEFRQLSQRMIDEECPESAALCHLEIAHIYEKAGNWNLQRKNLLKAAELFRQCQKKRSLMQYTVYSDLKNMIIDCYLRAVDLTMREGFLISAGVYSVELGSALMEMGDFTNAYDHLTRGYRLLQSDYYCQLTATSKLTYCAYTLGKHEEVLVMLDHLWADSMKRQPLSALGKKILVQAEINTILVLLKSKRSADGRHKLLLMSLKGDFSDAVDSVLSEQEFTIIKAFVGAVHANDVALARQVYSFSLKKLIDDTGNKVALDIMDSLSGVSSSGRPLTSSEQDDSAQGFKTRRQQLVARTRERLAL